MRVTVCPACGGADRHLHAANVFDHLSRAREFDAWSLWACAACRSVYLDPRPSDESLDKAYERYYTHAAEHSSASTSGLKRWATALVNGYMNRRFHASLQPASPFGYLLFNFIEPLRLKLDYHGRHLYLVDSPGQKRVLDVGSGNGEFLKRAGEMGWYASGLDPDANAVRACVGQGLKAWQGFIDSDEPGLDGRFDAVTLRHSIEHVADPRDCLRHCLRHLRPGGMIWLAWPNPRGTGAYLFRSAWRGLEAPRHLCIPSMAAMHDMLLEVGFVAPRALRRGHHARSISKESGVIAGFRPGIANRLRAWLAPLVGGWSDFWATLLPAGGEELVMVAFAPEKRRDLG